MSVPLTLQEILRQPDAWRQAVAVTADLAPRIAALPAADLWLFTGCGSSYYLAVAAAGFFQEITGRPARAVPASELIFSRSTFLAPDQKAVLVGFSRSGETTETVEALRRHQGQVIAVTCRAGGALSATGGIAVELPAADDQSVVMTSAFTTMLLAALLMAADLAGDAALRKELARVPGKAEERLEDQQAMAEQLGRALDEHRAFIFLGLGPFYGLALEAMLKMKEMAQVPCEAYSPMEFRHGPISIVGPETLVILIGSRRAREQEILVLPDIQELGGQTFNLAPGANEYATALLQMPFLQLLAYSRAVALGKDPDHPGLML